MRDDPVSLWLSDGVAWVTPSGDGCRLNAPKVKKFARETLRRGGHDFVVDLGECTGMDEDFIGVLAGMALRLQQLGRGQLQIVRCPPKLDSELRGLGLEQLFEM